MSMNRKYWQLETTDRVASLNIYGDITSVKWFDSDVRSYDIKQEIDSLDVDRIDVFINSYGGEVAEALAIYTALKRHGAEIVTYCDGFACSAASIIFCAGSTRIIGSIALLMIHNCMSFLGFANSEEMRKAAEDNDKINQSSIEAYKAVSNLSEDEIKDLMDNETWLTAEECLEYGFATVIAVEDDDEGTQQSVKASVREAILGKPKDGVDEIMKMLQEIKTAVQSGDSAGGEGEEPEEPEGPEEPEEEPKDPEDKPEESFEQKAAAVFGSLFN